MKKLELDIDLINEMLGKGLSLRKISKELTVDKDALTRFCKRNHIKTDNRFYLKDIKGMRFTKLTVINYIGLNKKGKRLWLCRCDCGNELEVISAELAIGRAKTCRDCRGSFKGIGELGHAYFTQLKNSAKKRNLDFTISIEYIYNLFNIQKGICVLSGLEIYLNRNRQKQTASLDRIDSNIGYIEGNVQWVHRDINYMKMDLSEEYFIQLCHLVSNMKEKKCL